METLADLAKVKSGVVESVARQGHSVLNFDDPITRGMARHARGRIVWFSLEGGANRGGGLAEHIGAGDMAVLREPGPAGGHIVLYKDRDRVRSEEHTSELQSLMRISYAVFCLKKKKTNKASNRTHS